MSEANIQGRVEAYRSLESLLVSLVDTYPAGASSGYCDGRRDAFQFAASIARIERESWERVRNAEHHGDDAA